MTNRQGRWKKPPSALEGFDVDCELYQKGSRCRSNTWYVLTVSIVIGVTESLNLTAMSRSVVVEFVEYLKTKVGGCVISMTKT